MRTEKVVDLLKQAQMKIQKHLKDKNIDMDYNKDGQSFGIWITIKCGKCGHDYPTPFYLKDDDKCRYCKKRLYDFKRSKNV